MVNFGSMKRKISTICSLILMLGGFQAVAQEHDLNALREVPEKESLRIDTPSLVIVPVEIPSSSLDLEVDYWRHWTTFGINANQASFSDNWNGGGVNSISIGVLFNQKSEYAKDNKSFVTELDLKYGKVKNKDQLARKSNDRIFWDNKAAFKLSKNWSLFASLTLETQFDGGYQYGRDDLGQDVRQALISNFMAPGYLTESFGLEYKPDKTFSLRFGTGTARQTFILDDRLVDELNPRFGVDTGKNFRNELAFQLVANIDRNLSKNLNLKGRYAFFANYEDFKNASHRLDATLSAKVSRVINVSLSGVVLYDKNVDLAVQTSQTLALGIMYKFPR